METSRFNSFSQADYDSIYWRLVNRYIAVSDNIEIAPDEVPTRVVVVTNLN